jgi:membrane protease YdiL (CAAX protease family)
VAGLRVGSHRGVRGEGRLRGGALNGSDRERVSTPSRRPLASALGVSALVTLAVTGASTFLPERHVATAVGFLFLGATWFTVWRCDDVTVEHHGLTFGGLVLPGRLHVRDVLRATALALAWALLLAAVTFVPFWLGWRSWWHPKVPFHLVPFLARPLDALNEIFGQLVIIALPEEAFYRGYLQTRIDDAFATRWRILGASVGPGLLIASAVFALGHVATIRDPARLAVFFPALVFGWLRARTGGVGASVAFHALCNIFSETLGRAYGVY